MFSHIVFLLAKLRQASLFCMMPLVKEENVIWDPSVPVGLTQAGEELGLDIYNAIAVRVVNSRRFLYPVAKT